jgi:two-component system cell cycle response regulator
LNKVLIIEPSNTFAQFAKYALTRLGYEIFHVQTATEALDKIEHIMPNLIISETTIRDISGLELCERIMQNQMLKDIPFVFISTDGLEDTRQKAKDAGCTDYLMKPVTAGEFHELMQRHLPFRKKRHHIRAKMGVTATIDDGEKLQEMRTLTLGEGGLYLSSEKPYNVGTRLTINLLLPSLNSPLILQGEVIYINDKSEAGLAKGMGVKFIELNQNMKVILRHYIQSYLSDYLSESPSIE